jgi:hypothetical protein
MAEAPPTGTPNPTAEKQLGSMVLDSNSGAIIQSSGDLSGDTKTAMLFYHMLQDTNAVLARMNKDPFRRLTSTSLRLALKNVACIVFMFLMWLQFRFSNITMSLLLSATRFM